MPIEFFQITAAYSNAMLVAIMPHVSDFAQKLDLPTPQPVTIAQVERFICFPRSDHIGGRVVLTNGCEFIFDHGRMERFDSPHSYYFLQDPDLVPKFYGPIKITEAQALQIAHNAIKKLGYTDAMLATDRRPRVDPPPQDGNHFIARYQIRWYDPTRGGDPNQPTRSIEFEINATTGQIETIDIPNPNTFRADLKLNVHPPVIYEMFKEGSHGTPIGPGRKLTPVTPAYAKAFLKAI
ncbi:MAG: PepSY domain-containing protein, partial [Limisphaerales bacterium]